MAEPNNAQPHDRGRPRRPSQTWYNALAEEYAHSSPNINEMLRNQQRLRDELRRRRRGRSPSGSESPSPATQPPPRSPVEETEGSVTPDDSISQLHRRLYERKQDRQARQAHRARQAQVETEEESAADDENPIQPEPARRRSVPAKVFERTRHIVDHIRRPTVYKHRARHPAEIRGHRMEEALRPVPPVRQESRRAPTRPTSASGSPITSDESLFSSISRSSELWFEVRRPGRERERPRLTARARRRPVKEGHAMIQELMEANRSLAESNREISKMYKTLKREVEEVREELATRDAAADRFKAKAYCISELWYQMMELEI